MKKLLCLIILLLINAGCIMAPEEYRVIEKATMEAERGNTDKAIKMLEEYQNTHPNIPTSSSAWIVECQARAYDQKGDTDKAISLLKGLIEKYPYLQQTYFDIGRLYLKKGQEQEAQIFFEKGKKLGLVELELQIAGQYEEAKMFDKAIDIYNKIISSTPDCVEGYACLGDIYRKKGNVNLALTNYKKALDLNLMGNETWMFQMVGDLYAISGEKDKAKQAYEQVIKISTYKPQVKMVQEILNFLNSDSYSKLLQNEQILGYMKQGDMNVLIDFCKEMTNKEPQESKWHFYLGAIYAIKEDESAKEEFKKVISIAPNTKEAKLSKVILQTL